MSDLLEPGSSGSNSLLLLSDTLVLTDTVILVLVLGLPAIMVMSVSLLLGDSSGSSSLLLLLSATLVLSDTALLVLLKVSVDSGIEVETIVLAVSNRGFEELGSLVVGKAGAHGSKVTVRVSVKKRVSGMAEIVAVLGVLDMLELRAVHAGPPWPKRGTSAQLREATGRVKRRALRRLVGIDMLLG